MFDVAWTELAVIAAIAIIVIGPKDLPRTLRVLGQWARKARNLAGEFQRNLDDMVRDAELDDVKKQVERVGQMDLKRRVEETIDPKGEIETALRVEEGSALPAPAPEITAPPADDEAARQVPKP